ncbi:MAG: MotA/TolQ/ExbB proton channel family protein [Gammaproteobacteria bacterium]|nr:MotA/TolQ/ExbB proton channel family protein [Gammaproteobacteria bacterium]
MFYYIPALASVRDFFELGGNVLYLIAGVLIFMWTLIFERIIFYRRRYPKIALAVQTYWENRKERESWHAHQVRERLVSAVGQELDRNVPLIQTSVALCPLLGLLGTVTGMIKVFETMALSGSGNVRSMAAGVSFATVPTMAGMVAALSGVAVSAYFVNRASRERELLADKITLDH